MTDQEILQQSKSAYGQWCVQWRQHAVTHKSFKMKPLTDFVNSGIGKAVLCVANGYSFQAEIETIKKYRQNVDILCCDKTLGHLIDNGIYPDFCMVCDANVNYDKYLKPWKDKLDKTVMFLNVCGNPQWSQNGNWKDIYFFVNRDILKSENEFSALSGCQNFIPAGTNVSNAMVILLNQSDESGKKNYFGYDKILTIGYDYSWQFDKNYYAFSGDGGGKKWYMNHITALNFKGELCQTSTNLMFSCRWLQKYVDTFKIPLFQCSPSGIFRGLQISDLPTQMQYNHKREDGNKVNNKVKEAQLLKARLEMIGRELNEIAFDHYCNAFATA